MSIWWSTVACWFPAGGFVCTSRHWQPCFCCQAFCDGDTGDCVSSRGVRSGRAFFRTQYRDLSPDEFPPSRHLPQGRALASSCHAGASIDSKRPNFRARSHRSCSSQVRIRRAKTGLESPQNSTRLNTKNTLKYGRVCCNSCCNFRGGIS